MWVRIPLETYIFILNFSLPPRSEQVNGAVANEIKHVHSPEVIVVLDPRYDLSNKALYISTCSIALRIIADNVIVFIYQEYNYCDQREKLASGTKYLAFTTVRPGNGIILTYHLTVPWPWIVINARMEVTRLEWKTCFLINS